MKPSNEYYFKNFIEAGIGKIPAKQVLFWENKALAELNALTASKIMQEDEENISIQQCICEIADALYIEENGGNIRSENNDGYSVTYTDGENIHDKIRRIAERYLLNTGLLYRGFDK